MTQTLKDGASSVKPTDKTTKWKVYTEPNFDGKHTILEAGTHYPSVKEMDLDSPVKSIQKN